MGHVRVKLRNKSFGKRLSLGEYRMLTGSIYSTGYRMFKLDNSKRHSLHRLLAVHFIPNPENKPCINHKNGNKLDNTIENLEWCTHQENSYHARNTGLVPPFSEEQRKAIQKKTRSKVTGKVYPSLKIACEQEGLNYRTTLSRIWGNRTSDME